jgi:chromosome partitioning protein
MVLGIVTSGQLVAYTKSATGATDGAVAWAQRAGHLCTGGVSPVTPQAGQSGTRRWPRCEHQADRWRTAWHPPCRHVISHNGHSSHTCHIRRTEKGRALMRRVVAIANGKGGVGKTSLTAGLAGLIAAAGYRVLTVDADPQGNLRRDLGYDSTDGQSLASAIQSGTRLEPLRDVRPNLDCIPGGAALYDLPATHVSRATRGESLAGLRSALRDIRPDAPAHADYDLILVDTPPGEPVLQDLVFSAADYLIIPTRSDDASLDGLVAVAHRFAAARTANPSLMLLGVLLFGVRSGSTRLRDSVREALEDTLEGVAPVFDSSIRYLESAAVDMRRHGLLPHELEQGQVKERSARLKRLRNGSKANSAQDLLSRDASGLAGDYAALAREVLQAIAAAESRRTESPRPQPTPAGSAIGA